MTTIRRRDPTKCPAAPHSSALSRPRDSFQAQICFNLVWRLGKHDFELDFEQVLLLEASIRAAGSRRSCSLLHVGCQPLHSKHSKRSTPHATLLKRTQTPAASPMVDDAFWEGHHSCEVTFALTSQMTCQSQVGSVASKWQQFVLDSATGIDWHQDFRNGV